MDVLAETSMSQHYKSILNIAHIALAALFNPPSTGNITPDSFLPPLLAVNVTLRTNGAVRGSWSGQGSSLNQQISDAVKRAALDRRFAGPLVRSDIKHTSIEVWLQTSAEIIPEDKRTAPDVLELGKHGVDVRLGSKFAYFKPSVAITSGFRSPQDFISAACKKADLPPDSWQSDECEVRRTTWLHLLDVPKRGAVSFNCLRPMSSDILCKKELRSWVNLGVNYLLENQEANGQFCYRYNPLKNASKPESPNPVRASGCTYSLALACSSPQLTNAISIKPALDRAVQSILSRTISFEGGLAVAERGKDSDKGMKLGSTALLAAALCTSTFAGEYETEKYLLLKSLVQAQYETGEFQCILGKKSEPSTAVNFFPGQALLALILAEFSHSGDYRDIYASAFTFYRNHFRVSPSTAFIGWHAEVWTRLALTQKNEEYAEFVFEQIDWLAQFQVLDTNLGANYGGFVSHGTIPSFSSIVYTEAVLRAVQLAGVTGDEARWTRYREMALLGLNFCSMLRLCHEQSFLFPNPQRSIGGFTKTISDFEVRSDFVQHGITMALVALDAGVFD